MSRTLHHVGSGTGTLLAFHGHGSNADDALSFGRAVGASAGWSVVAADGPYDAEGGGRAWLGAEGEPDRTVALVADLAAEAGAGPVVAIGSSQGTLAATFALGQGATAAALWLPIPPEPALVPADLTGRVVLTVAGEEDEIAHPLGARSLVRVLEARGATVTAETHPGGHWVPADVLVRTATWLAVLDLA